MSKRKLFSAIIGLCSIAALAGCKDNKPVTTENNAADLNTSSTGKLQILNTGTQLTQEQRLSQIKAEYLLQNNGYKDDDTITVILSLEDDSLVSRYSKSMSDKYESVNDYINSIEGQSYGARLEVAQNNLIKKLKASNLISNVLYKYNTVTNGIAVEMLYKDLDKVEGMTSIKYASLSETYNQVKEATSTSGYSVVENLVDVYKSTGIFNSSSVPYTGEGTAVAVLDSGFDVSHEVFSNEPQTELINMSTLDGVIGNLSASKTTEGLVPTDVYYSKKIPFMYDYADKDPDVAPFDSSHGTHVAGIIGGSSNHVTDEATGETFTGVAVNTQLVLMKVFGDKDSGAETEDILAGLEDSIILGVDCINMSLGSTCGFSREVDEEHINEVYDNIAAAGITCLAAASNDYSSGMNGPTGNTSLVTHPDSGTIGSPGSYDSTLTVASISGVKSGFVLGNDSQVFFFNESNQIDGTNNNFIKELYEILTKNGQISKMDSDGNITLEYVTVPGIGANINYVNCNVEGKIALVRRGTNTFEEKASIAKAYGAIACIIYNNVDGDIKMSMGKTGHVPTVSISKDDGTILASKDRGTMTFNMNNQAGPFMSDFSSWGPTPDLKLKPEITGHGGMIVSAIPGGGYEEMSGTSMATPNLCGVAVLIRQYLKEKYPGISAVELNRLANQLLMSTATIAHDEKGNSYSPRKQGAGLASLKKATTSNALISINNSDKSKIELGDDAKRTGVYTMTFNVENLSEHSIDYKLVVDAITESVSTSDYTHLAEKAQNLNGSTKIDSVVGGVLNDDVITVPANGKVTVTLTYTLSDEDKAMMDSSFPYGIYVEGFVQLIAVDSLNEVDLNVPFLGFYGDWMQAPILDKTFYEVESEAHNDAIDAEDKIAADYIATTPFASYLGSYVISLGTYIYDIPAGYDKIPASLDKIAVSDAKGTLDGISAIYAGLLRGCKRIDFTITDNVTGDVIYSLTDYNGRKSATSSGVKVPYVNYFRLKSADLNLVNNRKYTFNMDCKLDYGDGGVNTNIRNNFSYEFTFDNEAPVVKDASYEIVYDKALKKNRYYMTLDIYDNHYVQCITPLSFTSDSSYSILSPNPIPVYGERGTSNQVRFEITDYLKDMASDAMIGSAIPVQVTDYALNSNIFLCQLPGTKGDFKFTEDGTANAKEKTIQRVYVGEYLDLTQFLYSTDQKDTNDKAYFELLKWEVKEGYEGICTIKNGVVVGLKKGKAKIRVYEGLHGRLAEIEIDVRERTLSKSQNISLCSATAYSSSGVVEDAVIEDIRFSHFKTIYAHAECSERSLIGRTGDVLYINSLMDGLKFYPGEEIQLSFDFYPWYAKDNYEFTWTSTNPNVASVDQDGRVKGLKKGNTTITLGVNGSNIKARIDVTINSEFVIEDNVLVAYKGLGGDVVIPDDEGLINIGAYAFSLYTIDKEMYVDEKNYDANKIPSKNNTITSITVPKGIKDVQKYAFYNCTALKKVTFLDKIKNIYEYAFANCTSLEDINLENASVIGKYTFANCTALKNVDLSNIYAIGMNCFDGATALEYADLSSLRNNGENSFKGTTSLKQIVTNKDTKLSVGMFEDSGIEELEIYVDRIPAMCFKNCKDLESIVFNNSLVYVGESAFSGNTSLISIEFKQSVREIKESAFENCTSLLTLTLPNSNVALDDKAFSGCSLLATINFKDNTVLSSIGSNVFNYTAITNFNSGNNTNYSYENNLLLNSSKTEIVFANSNISGEYTIPTSIEYLGPSSFSACNELETVIINHNLSIKNGTFAGLNSLNKLQLANDIEVVVGNNAFMGSRITTVENATSISAIGEAAFMNSRLDNIILGDDLEIGPKAFSQTKLISVTLGKNTVIGKNAFENNQELVTVNMPADGGVSIGEGAFYNNQYLGTIDLTKAVVIGNNSFNNCISLLNANIEATEIGDYAFANCKGLANVSLNNTKSIGDYAFALTNDDDTSRAPKIESLSLPNTLEYIGDYAFASCKYLESIIIPSLVQYVGHHAFASCSSLASVVIPEDLEEINEFTFSDCTNLSSINLDKIITINMGAFANCGMLVNVDLECVEVVGAGAFQNARLANLTNTANIINIGPYAFSGNLFTSFDSTSVEVIGEGAFMNAANLTSFTLFKDIEKISSGAFYGASKLTAFYALQNGKSNGKINDYAFVENGVLYTHLENGKQILLAVPAALNVTTLVVKENTYRVEAFAGNANRYVQFISLPDGLKNIGDAAFYNYSSLKKVTFNTSTAPVLENKYDSELLLNANHPGYNVLHNVYSFFDIVYSYKNFKALAGALATISLVLPSNEEVLGYDSLVYQLYFGDYKVASRTNYEAMDKNTVEFLDNIVLVPNINELVFRDQAVVLNALTSYNKLKQDLTNYGYTSTQVEEMVSNLLLCKSKIQELKLSYASTNVQNIQSKINELGSTFSIDKLKDLYDLNTQISNLSRDDKEILDLSSYNLLKESYNEYRNQVKVEANEAERVANNVFKVAVITALTTSVAVALAVVITKKYI